MRHSKSFLSKMLLLPTLPLGLAILSIASVLLTKFENPYGLISDIYGFCNLHFSDGLQQWPLSERSINGQARMPVEYPPLTALIMWIYSFAVKQPTDCLRYYDLFIVSNSILLFFSALILNKMIKGRKAYILILCPALLYSLNRHWDIWMLPPLLLSIYYFDKQKYRISAISLSIAISIKFFPIYLLIPILVILWRRKEWKIFYGYFATVIISFITINIGFILADLNSWLYFYKFHLERRVGSGTIFEFFSKIGVTVSFPEEVSMVLTFILFIALLVFLYFFSKNLSLSNTALITMAVFLTFNKVYSLQYAIILSALALLALYDKRNSLTSLQVKLFWLWQFSEVLFAWSSIQNWALTQVESLGYTMDNFQFSSTIPKLLLRLEVTDGAYAAFGFFRYFTFLAFVTLLCLQVSRNTESIRRLGSSSKN